MRGSISLHLCQLVTLSLYSFLCSAFLLCTSTQSGSVASWKFKPMWDSQAKSLYYFSPLVRLSQAIYASELWVQNESMLTYSKYAKDDCDMVPYSWSYILTVAESVYVHSNYSQTTYRRFDSSFCLKKCFQVKACIKAVMFNVAFSWQ